MILPTASLCQPDGTRPACVLREGGGTGRLCGPQHGPSAGADSGPPGAEATTLTMRATSAEAEQGHRVPPSPCASFWTPRMDWPSFPFCDGSVFWNSIQCPKKQQAEPSELLVTCVQPAWPTRLDDCMCLANSSHRA